MVCLRGFSKESTGLGNVCDCGQTIILVLLILAPSLFRRAEGQQAANREVHSQQIGWTLEQTRLHYRRAVAYREPFGPVFLAFQELAVQGSVEAKAWVGICLLFGHGIPPDTARGVQLVREAAAAGDPAGMRLLAHLESTGRFVPSDPAGAMHLYEEAIGHGDAGSYDPLAMAYLFGRGVAKDQDKAMLLLRTGAAASDPNALLHLGEMYERGDLETHVPRDRAHAAELYRGAVAGENVVAMSRLGHMLLTGAGVPEDRKQAVAFLEIAAEAGVAPAQAELSAVLANEASPDARIRAYAWSYLASLRGNKSALDTMMSLSGKLSGKQIADAKAFASTHSTEGRSIVNQTPE